MELIDYIANSCTTRDKTKQDIIYLLNYIYLKDKKILTTLDNIKSSLLKDGAILTIGGLKNILMKTNKKEMYSFISYWQVKKYLNRTQTILKDGNNIK